MQAAGTLWIQEARYEVTDPDAPRPAGTIGTNLAQEGEGLAEIFTDVEEGEMLLTLDIRDAPPTEVHTDQWDAVFDLSVASSNGTLIVRPFQEEKPPSWCPSMAQHGPGSYRVRCHRRTGESQREEHLLSVWPSPHQPVKVHKLPAQVAPLPKASLPTPQPPQPGAVQPGVTGR